MKVMKFKCEEGEKLNLNPHKPVIIARPGYGYIWIGNAAKGDEFCFATLSGRKTLLRLADAIRKAAERTTRIDRKTSITL